MTQYTVKVNKLNKRKGPVSDFKDKSNVVGEALKGDKVEIINEITNKLGKWLQDKDGVYYWSEGLSIPHLSPGVFAWWLKNANYSIPDFWTNDPDTKVSIAILDSGINEHIDFDFSNISGRNYLDNSKEYKTDEVGHGTHIAGIMVAKGLKSFGIVPQANLFVAKICDNAGTPSLKAVKNALTDIYNNTNGALDIDVINMSFNLVAMNTPAEKQTLSEIRQLLKNIAEEGKALIVAACGDEDWVFENFPASLDECISVGSIGTGFKRSSFSTKSSTLDIMAPGEDILSSVGTDSVKKISGTSQATAIVSALCACGIKKLRKNGIVDYSKVKKTLFQTAVNNSYKLEEYGHGIINPNLFMQVITPSI